jgi:hypothetical protein
VTNCHLDEPKGIDFSENRRTHWFSSSNDKNFVQLIQYFYVKSSTIPPRLSFTVEYSNKFHNISGEISLKKALK